MSDEPDNRRPSPEVIRQGYEPLSTNTRALATVIAIFVAMCAVMGWGLWLFLGHYLDTPRSVDATLSAAPALLTLNQAPLAPSIHHNDLDWQDLVHVRQREDRTLRRMGCTIDPRTGEVILPTAAIEAVRARYAHRDGSIATHPSADLSTNLSALRFPPPIAPVRAGAAQSLLLANVFPPVGAAAVAEQTKPSIARPSPGPADIKQLPEQTGPAGVHNNPTAEPKP